MKKRVLTILFCIVFMVSSVSAFADYQPESELEFALSRASSLLTKTNYEILNDHAYLSAPIPQYTLNPLTQIGNVYLVFDGSEHIGLVFVYTVNGERYSTARLQSFDCLNTALLDGTSIAFLQANRSMLVHVGDQWIVLSSSTDSAFETANIATQGMTHSALTIASEILLSSARSIYYRLTGVPFASNEMSPGGTPLCWAATMAMKISYQNDLSTPLTALDVYNACKATSPSSEPYGTNQWYSVAANCYGISLTIVEGHLSKSTISRCFNQDKPIILGIQGSVTSIAHAVLLCGIDEYSTYYELAILDPNKTSSFVFTTIPLSCLNDGEDFYYNDGSDTYTNWTYSRY